MFVPAKKDQVGWRVPVEVRDEFERIAGESANGKQRWAVFSAAVMLLMEAGDVREELIDLSLRADRRDDFKGLLERVRTNGARAVAEESGGFTIPAKKGKPALRLVGKDARDSK